MKIEKRVENIYKSIIKKYIERNNLQSHLVYYPLQNNKNIIVPRTDYTNIYFVVDTTKRLQLKFNEDGKLLSVSWLDEFGRKKLVKLTYKDFIYAYKRIKEIGIMLV
jgi:hypothetical protein